MATAVCAGPSLWVFSSKRALCRSSAEPNSFSQLTPSSFTCKLESHLKQGFPGARYPTSKKRASPLIAHSIERLGLGGKLSEEDVSESAIDSRSAIEEEPSLELVDTDGIIFEESDEIDGMLRQPRSFDDWEMFAAEEGARPADDDETDSEVDDASRPVRRRSAGDALPFPAVNWSAADKQKVDALQAFKHRYESKGGLFLVEAMRPKHMADTEELLIDSFAELMGGLLTYRPLLAFTVKQYVRERYATLPHSVTLVGLYSPAAQAQAEAGASQQQESGASSVVVAGTVELSFSVAGHPDVPTPAPPPNSPYICNMAIKKEYRRRGLGRQMLKAAEELALSMGCEDMYLHVRIMDTAPLTMYREAGYQVVSTDSLLSVLTFQRRRHLMRKRLSRAKLVPEE